MKRLIQKLLILIVLLAFGEQVIGKRITPLTDYKAMDSIGSGGYVARGSDLLAAYTYPYTDTSWRADYCYKSAEGRVVLRLKNNNVCMPQSFTYNVTFRISYYTRQFTWSTFDTTLRISYDKTSGKSYTERAVYVKKDVHYIKAEVLSISDAALNKYVCAEAILEEDRNYCGFATTMVPVLSNINYESSTDQIQLNFGSDLVNKCDFLEVEYTFIDAYSAQDISTFLPKSLLWYDFRHNANRVSITSNLYTISNVFESGYLVFRARAVVMTGLDGTIPVYGNWSVVSNGKVSDVSTTWIQAVGLGGTIGAHQLGINWQYQAEYAEEGKKKEIITYYDGLLSKRETVTRNHSDQMVLVSEDIYDHIGRPAVQTLPVPAFENKLRFFAQFNKGPGGEPYNPANFEMIAETTNCVKPNGDDAMSGASGASFYYSANNPLMSGGNSIRNHLANFIPDAGGYPFSRAEFMPDQTSRVRRQSGPGATHKMGAGHETQYMYVIPTQVELFKLFGTEVGKNVHYKKNIVIDPNGQSSVSYVNASGKVIATGLFGESSSQTDALATMSNAIDTIASDLMDLGDTLYDKGSVTLNYTFAISNNNTNYQLKYSLEPQSYLPTCNASSVCYDCVYDLEIKVISEQCNDVLLDIKRKIGNSENENLGDTTCNQDELYDLTSEAGIENVDGYARLTLDKGSYRVIKTLSVNQAAYDYYLKDFMDKRLCKTKDDFVREALAAIDTNQCELTCEKCLENLGTQTAFIQQKGQLSLANGDSTISSLDTVAFKNEYAYYKSKCDFLCQTTPTGCDVYLQILKADMSPGGQYCSYQMDTAIDKNVEQSFAHSTGRFNILAALNDSNEFDSSYRNHPFFAANGLNIGGVFKYFKNFTVDEIVSNWQDTFTNILVRYHPEYCRYLKCKENDVSTGFIDDFLATETYQQADTKNYLNPLTPVVTDDYFKSGRAGYSFQSYFGSRLANYKTYDEGGITRSFSIWDVAVIQLFCSDKTDPTEMRQCLDLSRVKIDSCVSTKDFYWLTFRNLYSALRQQLVDSLTNLSLYKGTACNADRVGTYYQVRFPENTLMGNLMGDPSTSSGRTTIQYSIDTQMTNACHSTCEAYIPLWYSSLKGCNLNATDSASIMADLLEVCQNSCDKENDLGSSTVAPSIYNSTSVKYNSFYNVLKGSMYGGTQSTSRGDRYVPGVCDDVLITMPRPFGHDYLSYNGPFADTCACNSNLYNNPVVGNPDCRDTVNTPNPNCVDCATGISNEAKKALLGSKTQATQYRCKSCIDCDGFKFAIFEYFQRYPTFVDSTSVRSQEVFTGFLNNFLKFNLTFDEYIKYGAGCADTIVDFKAVVKKFAILIQMQGGGAMCNVTILPPASPYMEGWDRNKSIDTCGCNIIQKAEKDFANHLIDTNVYPTPKQYVEQVFNCGKPLLDYDLHKYICFSALNGLCIDSTLVKLTPNDSLAKSITPAINWSTSRYCPLGGTRMLKTYASPTDSGAFLDGYYWVKWIPAPTHSATYILHELGWAGSKDNLSNLNSCVPPVCCSKLCNRPFNEIPLIVENPCKTLLKNAAYLNANSAYKAYRDSMEGVFKVAYIKKCMFTDQVEQMEDLYKQQQYQYTLYYYDQAGNLVKTVPPAGVRPLNNEQAQGLVVLRKLGSTAKFTPSHKMITTYAYNSLNSPIWQKTPDAGESWFYYDQLGRLVVSQNGNQRTVVNSQTRYSYTVFDNLNRITEVGQLSQASPITDDKLRVSADLTAWISASTKEQITKTYYDLADYAVVDTFLFKPENLRNRVVYTTYQSKNNGSAYDHAVHYSYDVHGNVKMLLREIKGLNVLLQDYKIVSYDYDLVSGKVNQVIYQKGEVDQYIHQYQYDADNRLTQVFSGTSPYSLDNDASYYYYLHGPLARTELGSQKVQGVDYSYTIQGWLKAVNSGHLNSLRDMGRDGYLGASGFNGNGYLPADEFGFNLGYFEGDYQQIGTMNIGSMSTYQKPTIQTQSSAVGNQAADLFNGNIRMMAVAIRQFGTLPLTNTYRYDQLNRLIESNSWNSYDSTNNAYFSSGSALTQYKNTFNYDANGNILKQLRNGGPSQVNLDSLSYFYYTNGEDLTNKLMYVKDNVSKTNYTDDIDNQVNSNNYKYDEIGNLISDSSEEISSIEWNVYGKINRIKRYSYSIRPDLEFEYSPDGHRVVKIVKPKNGGMNVYTYYVRDAQGNVLATYNRTYSVTLDFSQMTYAKVNDTIIKYETLDGLAGLNATVSNVSGLRSLYYTNLQNDTVFAKTINPYNLLINYPGGLDSVLNNLSNEAYAEILFTMNPSITDLCECYKARNLSPDYLNSILLTMMRNEGPFDDLLDRIATQQGSAGIFSVATALGIPIGDLPTTISDIHSYVFSSSDPEASFQTLISELATQYPELSNCTGLPITILDDLKRNFPATFYSYLGNADGVRDLFRTALSSCNLAQSNEDIASRLSSTYANLSWQLLLQTNSSANLLAWERDSDTYTFTNQAIKYQKSTIASYQTSNNLYGGPYGGIENYFSQIKSYFGQTKYDQMIQGFMRASSLYMDTIRLAEWHIYGSSRVGIYEANLHLASRSVRIESGTETQVNSTAITYQSYSYFTTERGTKRFELTNHLGNVLAVVTDKKVAICSTEVFTFWKAELVSATDYAPFGAPLASRTYQASEYRFSFNGQEKIDEINGAGNDLDFGARVYDARLGRWMAGDPLEYKYPGVSPYNFSLNIPIMVNDPDGKDFRVSITKGKNGVNVITIESTIHLYGPDAEVLFSQIKGFTANGVVNIDGQEYQINITVAYTVNAKLNEAIPAEVHDRIETNLDTRKYKSMGVDRGDNIAYINSKLFMPFAGVTAQGEDDTKVKNVKPETLIHESLHMLGLDERYSFAGIDKNFFLDYMSNSPKRNDLNKIHFYDFAKFVKDNIPESASCLPVPEPKVDDTGGVSNSTHHETDDRTYRDNSSKVSKNNFYLIK